MLDSPSLRDDDLLRLTARGDERAFLEFYRRHQGAVYRFALQMSGKREVAEEVTQDVFMVVMGAAKQYDPQARVGAGVPVRDRAEFRAAQP